MDDTQNPPAEEPVAPAPAVPELPADQVRASCVDCKEEVLKQKHTTYRKVDGDYKEMVVCQLCLAVDGAARISEEMASGLRRQIETELFLSTRVVPKLRRAGIQPEMLTAMYGGGININPENREQGMAIAGVLGGMLKSRNLWKKDQQGDEAKFRLSGEVVLRPGRDISILISNVAPSDSCTVTYVEEDVPAKKVRKAKIVCKDPDPAPSEAPAVPV